jgi:hypothetical protein
VTALAYAHAHAHAPAHPGGAHPGGAHDGGAHGEARKSELARQPSLFAVAPTLDVAVSRQWDALRIGATDPCLLCGGEMEPRWSAGHGAVGGRCTTCGTVLE